ncbi:hypothetical protein AAVH_34039, partial [Aphelenchoides avenae]
LDFTPELATLIFQAPIVAHALRIDEGSCADLTPTQFQEVLLHFSPASLDIDGCRLRACQLTDGFIRGLSKARVQCMTFYNLVPVDADNFGLTDDAIVDFCVQDDVQIGQEGDATAQRSYEELDVCNGSFTKELFKRLVEASSASTRTQPLQITVSPFPFEEEDLRDFSQYLSRQRGEPYPFRVYDFPVEQQGADAAIHLQIVLHPGNTLTMLRAQRPNSYFKFY